MDAFTLGLQGKTARSEAMYVVRLREVLVLRVAKEVVEVSWVARTVSQNRQIVVRTEMLRQAYKL